jgi:hypothetical protein
VTVLPKSIFGTNQRSIKYRDHSKDVYGIGTGFNIFRAHKKKKKKKKKKTGNPDDVTSVSKRYFKYLMYC